MLGARAATPHLQRTRGSIVITASSSSFYPGRGGSLYVASKFAVRGLVVQLAHELAPVVRVNAVAPGGTLATDLRGLRALDQHENRLADRPGREEALRRRTPLGVAMRPEDHAAAYVFLASDRCAGMTGEILRSDGGLAVR
jgi:NAD(P)-dependent dehydrogenase (short-subunit alcohol dehydrogenase family)